MKILHLITGLGRGGAETTLARLAGAKDPGDLAHVVVSLQDEGVLGAEIRAAGVAVHTLGMRPGRPALGDLRALRRLIRRERPDVVQTWLYHADFIGTLATRAMGGLPLVWNIRRSVAHREDYGRALFLLVRALARLSRLPDAVVANSAAGRRAHEALGYRPRRWAIIPNGIDTARFRPDAEARRAVRAEWGIAEGERLIGFVGRLHPVKDPGNLLAAAAELARARRDFRVAIVGDDPDGMRPDLEDRARGLGVADRLVWAGPRADMPRVHNAFDVLALASHAEGFPNVVAEAMASGVPCVATDVGDAREIAGPAARVVPPRDPAALAEGLGAALDADAATRAAWVEAARRRIAERYSLDAMVRAYAELYRDLAGGR